jgi:Hsp70 protein/TIR domain/DnaJ C terminal domain
VARVFISYRRSDTRWAAGRLYDRLAEMLGRDNVFFDVSDIEPGEDFVFKIGEIVGKCDVLLAVIGPTWLSTADESGRRRLQSPRDLIRVEISTALQRNIRVIPVLVDGAEMPHEDQLPEDLASLARRNARDVSFNRFHADLDSFIRVLERIIAGPGAKPQSVDQAAAGQGVSKPRQPIATEAPFTISLQTLGGMATALISKGASLPAEGSQIFSTAEDNQSVVTITLFAGEADLAKDNFAIGTFDLDGIPPGPRGAPEIDIKAIVDPALILTVTAEERSTRRRQVLDAVDLTQISLPDSALRGTAQAPTKAESPRDSRLDLKRTFGGIFEDFFGSEPSPETQRATLDRELQITLTGSEAAAGSERTIDLDNGRQIRVKIPPGIKAGQQLRIRGHGFTEGGRTGDLYISVSVKR